MNQHYEPEFKKIVRLHLEEGRFLKGLAAEYRISHASISNWTNQFRKECQTNEEAKVDYDYMKENLQLKKQLAEFQKKDEIKNSIRKIYHSHGGVDGYRIIHAYLIRTGHDISRLTVHKYMNTEMQLFSISRKKKPEYEHGIAHKVYENKLNQDFHADAINQKWCKDFTYLFLTDGSKRYNCTILDLHDRSVIASITDRNITSDLAKRTLEKAIHSQSGIDLSKLLVHSDQGSQYTSKEFTEFCEKLGITQSMSKAGYPYDNAPMERYFNTLKNDLIHQHYYHTEDELYTAIEEFAYVQYNHVCPHSYKNYKTPYEACYGVA